MLRAGDLPAARRAAERLDRERPDDPRVLILRGRVMLAWPVIGRWQAETLLTRAGELAPGDPEPFFYLGLVGIALRGDDGEWIARRGFTRVLALDPHYRDTWPQWSGLYRGDAERRAGVAALALHAGDPAADLWRAQLLVELADYDAARPVLEQLIARSPADPAPRALLAQLLFEMGLDADGATVYDAALACAAADTGAVLWRQVRATASPGERAAYESTPPAGRTAFFHRFWTVRRPDLRAPLNGRIGEHFRRLREARGTYPLLHPNGTFFHSARRRSAPLFDADVPACQRALAANPRRAAVPRADAAQAADPDETLNLEDGLDDRGRVFVRYGPPDERLACSVGAETWRYHVPQGDLQVTFARRSGADSSGDVLVTPIAGHEWEAARWLLATDRPTAPETLELAFWTAAFRGASPGQTELVVVPDSVAVLGVLSDGAGRDVTRDSGTGAPLLLVATPARYLLALDGTRGDRVGRFRGGVTLPAFAGDSLALSGLLLTDRDAAPERGAMIAAAPARLGLAHDRPLRLYAEVYGLTQAAGRSRFDAEYRFEPLGRARAAPTSVRFRRDAPARSATVESLVIDPGRLAPGRYRLRLVVRDALAGTRAASGAVEFDLR